jgi:hypothetical protein
MSEEYIFPGFPTINDQDGFTQISNHWFDILQQIDNLAELKVVFYVMRHTWGYQDKDGKRDEFKKITTDEFVNGRQRSDETRIDSGTNLGLTATKDGIKKATQHQYLICDVNDNDRARIKKYYGLKMLEKVETLDSRNPTADGHNPTIQGRIVTTNETHSDHRTKKETLRNKPKKETDVKETVCDVSQTTHINIDKNNLKDQKIPHLISREIEKFGRSCGAYDEKLTLFMDLMRNVYLIAKLKGTDNETFKIYIYTIQKDIPTSLTGDERLNMFIQLVCKKFDAQASTKN